MRVLITRPIEAARETAAALAARGHEPLVEPLLSIRIEPGPAIDVGAFHGLVLTSANGARAAAARIVERAIPVIAVGPATAAQARASGFTAVEEADGNGTDGIVAHLARKPVTDSRPLLHISGADVAGDLLARVQALGLTIERRTLYKAVAATRLTPAMQQALKEHTLHAALFFSPRSSEIFARLVAEAALEPALAGVCACVISQNAADALKLRTFRKVLVAKDTTTEAVMDLLDKL